MHDFFDPQLASRAGAAVFLMRFIMHDWADTYAARILRHLRAAAAHGLRTVFVPRPREPDSAPDTRARADGGEVDLVVRDFYELARVLEGRPPERQSWQR